jgi:hypothetical protein
MRILNAADVNDFISWLHPYDVHVVIMLGRRNL